MTLSFPSERNPRGPAELASFGWDLKAITTGNGWEFRNDGFTQAVTSLGAVHRLIRAGRPTSNGAVERVRRTILDEDDCRKLGAMRRDESLT